MLSALSSSEFAARFARVNLLAHWPGRARGKGAAFPMPAARACAEEVRRRFVSGRTVVLLGKRVAAAFGIRAAYLEPVACGRAVVYVMPHPSGVNRWFNEAENVRRARAFMTALAWR